MMLADFARPLLNNGTCPHSELWTALMADHPHQVDRSPPASLIELLRRQADDHRGLDAYRYLVDDNTELAITFDELDRRARALASTIRQVAEEGDRALLVFPPGLDFLVSFFACLYAGVLAVPATYPKPKRPMPRLSAIAGDCEAKIALCTSQTLGTVEAAISAEELRRVRWLAVDTEVADGAETQWRPPQIGRDSIAFLQYTSGSTSDPKGVMVSHGNLLANLEMIRRGFDIEPGPPGQLAGIGVTWLPAYHDMGLIGGLLEPLYVGGCSIILPPTAFLQSPLRWLKAISHYGALVSGAPNFAYDLCVRKISDEQAATLDLSAWRVAFCGAEPVRSDTMRRFRERFGPCGFRDSAFYPCYGLAEATLLAAGGDGPGPLTIHRVLRAELLANRAVPALDEGSDAAQDLVGCGHSPEGQDLVIADPDRCIGLPQGTIGEIWLRGPNIALGYWNREEENRETFAARLAGDGASTYLRTGDLGFLRDGQLYVTGRLKDLIIIRGRNHYPQDVERTVERAHDALLPSSAAAFSVDIAGNEELVVVQELDRHWRHADVDEIIRRVRADVAREHELDAATVVLIREGSLPRTTSGKVQRGLCRQQFFDGALKVVHRWDRQSAASDQAVGDAAARPALPPPAIVRPNGHLLSEMEVQQMAERIEAWLMEWLRERTRGGQETPDANRPFAEYGIDSLSAVELSAELQQLFQVEVTPTVAWNYPTPASLARYLAGAIAGAGEGAAETAESAPPADEFERLLAEIETLDEDDAAAALDEAIERDGDTAPREVR